MTREQEQLAVELDGLAQRMREYFQQVLDSINRIADVYGLRELAQKAKAEAETDDVPEWAWAPGDLVTLVIDDTIVLAERDGINRGWLVPGVEGSLSDAEVSQVERVILTDATAAESMLKQALTHDTIYGAVMSMKRGFIRRGLKL